MDFSRTLFTALAFAMPGLAAADGMQPSFDCLKASSSAEELVCARPDLARLDRRLADRFAAAIEKAQSYDAGAGDAEDLVRATQRGWIGGRDECWKAQDPAACVKNAYLIRENELVAMWMLEEPTAMVSYACAGNPANEVVAMFFDTERPAVRLEHGDTVDAGSLTQTASGARYDARFGRSIWIKGDEAVVTWPEGNEMNCVPQ